MVSHNDTCLRAVVSAVDAIKVHRKISVQVPRQILPATAVQSAHPAFRRLKAHFVRGPHPSAGNFGQMWSTLGFHRSEFSHPLCQSFQSFMSILARSKEKNRPKGGGREKPFEGIRGCRAACLQGEKPPRPATVV